MPKIITDLEGQLIAETKRQLEENGYRAVTIRSIAKGCGVGVGTVYNYFPSKDSLIATHLLEDWRNCVAAIEKVSSDATEPSQVVACIYFQLRDFAGRHSAIFRDEAATASFSGSFSQYHGLLRSQLAKPLQKFCRDAFSAEFIAESLVTWTMAGKTFEELYDILEKLF